MSIEVETNETPRNEQLGEPVLQYCRWNCYKSSQSQTHRHKKSAFVPIVSESSTQRSLAESEFRIL
jgi:hypothetical protein